MLMVALNVAQALVVAFKDNALVAYTGPVQAPVMPLNGTT